jgi:hypothetical protein
MMGQVAQFSSVHRYTRSHGSRPTACGDGHRPSRPHCEQKRKLPKLASRQGIATKENGHEQVARHSAHISHAAQQTKRMCVRCWAGAVRGGKRLSGCCWRRVRYVTDCATYGLVEAWCTSPDRFPGICPSQNPDSLPPQSSGACTQNAHRHTSLPPIRELREREICTGMHASFAGT